MIKLFDDDGDQDRPAGEQTPVSGSPGLTPEPESSPPAQGEVAAASADGVVGAEPPVVIEEPPADPPAAAGEPISDQIPEQPAEKPVEKIQEEPAELRREEVPGPEPADPPPHVYGPEDPEATAPETGREFPPGFSGNGPKEPDVIVQQPYKPPSKAEAIRNSGLAWSAGIIFFGSIVFMLILGWGADLLLGSSPWGIVGGIVLGSLIGFIQFFRISSQIFRK